MIRKTENRDATDYRLIWNEAHKAGAEAADDCTPEPMVIQERENQWDDDSPVKKSYFVPQGVCGFAWIIVRPATCGFARWCRKNKGTSKAYYGGEQIWISAYGQSYEKKKAYAGAFAATLYDYDIKAYSAGRLD